MVPACMGLPYKATPEAVAVKLFCSIKSDYATMKFLQSILLLVIVSSLTSADGLTLSLSHPDPSDLSIIRFTCKDGEYRAVTATFQKNGENITDQISVIINRGGILEFEQTSNQGLGGTFTCTDNGITSNAITLPGENMHTHTYM